MKEAWKPIKGYEGCYDVISLNIRISPIDKLPICLTSKAMKQLEKLESV